MNEWDVHSLLVKTFNDLGYPASSVAFEQREFTPPTDHTVWYALYNLPASRDVLSLGNAGDDEYVGVFQIDVRGEQGDGIKAVLQAASVLTAYYKAGSKFTSAAGYVLIRRSEVSPVRRDGVRVVASVSVYWSARLQR